MKSLWRSPEPENRCLWYPAAFRDAVEAAGEHFYVLFVRVLLQVFVQAIVRMYAAACIWWIMGSHQKNVFDSLHSKLTSLVCFLKEWGLPGNKEQPWTLVMPYAQCQRHRFCNCRSSWRKSCYAEMELNRLHPRSLPYLRLMKINLENLKPRFSVSEWPISS